MHEVAREHNRQHPEPTLRLDLCGYEYATLHPGQEFTCSGCGRKRVAVAHESAKLEIAFNDPEAPLGRRQEPAGSVCNVLCAERAFGVWYWRRCTESSDQKDAFDVEAFMGRLASGELDEACTKLLRHLGIREPESSDQEDAAVRKLVDERLAEPFEEVSLDDMKRRSESSDQEDVGA